MKRFNLNALKCAAFSAALFAASSAFATGPSYQYILDSNQGGGVTGVGGNLSTFNDVVSLSTGATIGGSNGGSGTVIGASVIPVSPTTSDAVFSILTAAHVAGAGITKANFGAGPNANDNAGNAQSYLFSGNVNGTYQTFTITSPNNPNNLPVDIAIMQANVFFPTGNMPANLNNVLKAANIPTLATDFGAAAGSQSVGFTQVGYGQGGVWNGTAAGAGDAYNGNGKYDARRFQNNTSTNLFAPATVGGFFEPLVADKVLAPSVPNGTGTGYDADSGGPWFTKGPGGTVTVSPKNPDDWNQATGAGNPPAAPYTEDTPRAVVGANSVVNVNDVNNLSAEFVLATIDPDFPNARDLNSEQDAVPLLTLAQMKALLGNITNTQGTFEWATGFANNPVSVPEPTTLSVLAVGGIALLRRRAR